MLFAPSLKNMKKTIIMGFLAGILWGCSTTKPLIQPEKTALSLFSEAMSLAEKKKYRKAAETFELIQRTHPENPLVQKGQIYASWCYLQDHSGAEALGALELMENLHPGCPFMDLVFYLKALIYYEKRLHIQNNQDGLIWSLRVMKDIVRFFPTSIFAQKAKKEMVFLQYTIFYHDLLMVEYFMKRGMYLSALIVLNNALFYYPHKDLYAQGLYYGLLCSMGLDAQSFAKEFWKRLSLLPPCEERENGQKLFQEFCGIKLLKNQQKQNDINKK